MTTYFFEEQGSVIVNNISKHKTPWIYFFRQLYIVAGMWLLYFTLGLSFGAPTVIIAQMRREANSSDAVSPVMESWLTSVHGYSAVPFVIVLPLCSEMFGRKIVFIFITGATIIGYVVFYWSINTMQILISEMIQGVLLGSNLTFLIAVVTEYASLRYRAIYMTIKEMLFFMGVLVANAFGFFFDWRTIGLAAFVCCGYSLTSLFWPESPSWLAMKGRFEEAKTVHRWLNGYNEESEKELDTLINSQKMYLSQRRECSSRTWNDKLKIIICTVKDRGFYYPLLLTVAVISLFHFSGKLVCTMYAIQLLKQITNNESTAYIGMMLLEGITVLSMVIGCAMTKYFKRRSLLISSSCIAIITLIAISLYLYLIHLKYVIENPYVSIALLTFFSVAISYGPMIFPALMLGDVVSLRYKCSSLLIVALYSEILLATLLKLAPNTFLIFGLHGAFLFYAVFSAIFTILIYKYLPETKDKTVEEIDNYFKDKSESDFSNEFIRVNNINEYRWHKLNTKMKE